MSSRKIEKVYQETEKFFEGKIEKDISISHLVIPFSKFKRNYKIPDIYSGKEKIPFVDRDPDYKTILKQEFTRSFNEFKIYRPVVTFPSF